MNCGRNSCGKMFIVILICIGTFWIYKTSWHRDSSAATSISINPTTNISDSASILNSKDSIEKIIKDFIIEHPEVIIESMELMQKRKVQDMESKLQDIIKEKKAEIEDSTSSPHLGANDGAVVITMFYDYNCGYCKKANDTLNDLLKTEQDVKVIYKPLAVLGDASDYISRLALATYAINPDKFKDIHTELMGLSSPSPENVKNIFGKHGINFDDIEIEASSPNVNSMHSKILSLASQLRINGTPAFVINGHLYTGFLDTPNLQKILEDARARNASNPNESSKDTDEKS